MPAPIPTLEPDVDGPPPHPVARAAQRGPQGPRARPARCSSSRSGPVPMISNRHEASRCAIASMSTAWPFFGTREPTETMWWSSGVGCTSLNQRRGTPIRRTSALICHRRASNSWSRWEIDQTLSAARNGTGVKSSTSRSVCSSNAWSTMELRTAAWWLAAHAAAPATQPKWAWRVGCCTAPRPLHASPTTTAAKSAGLLCQAACRSTAAMTSHEARGRWTTAAASPASTAAALRCTTGTPMLVGTGRFRLRTSTTKP